MNAHYSEPSLLARPQMDRQFIAPLPKVAPADEHDAWFDEAETAEWKPVEPDLDALSPGPAISTPTILSIATVVMMLAAAFTFAM